RRRAWRASCRISRTAMSANASYSSRVTRRPAFSFRVVPRNRTDAPAAGSPTAASKLPGSIGTSTIAKGSATAHRGEECHLVAVGELVTRFDVALVDGDPDAHGSDRRLHADERFPQRTGRGACTHRAVLARAEALAQRREEAESHA